MATTTSRILRSVFCTSRQGLGARLLVGLHKAEASVAVAPVLVSKQSQRWFSHPAGADTQRQFSSAQPALQKKTVKIHFKLADGTRKTASAKVGENLLDAVVTSHLDIDGYGACEGTLACSTCHLVFNQKDFEKLPSKPTDEELDMLDLAYGLSDTSRLGCQVIVTEQMDGWEVTVPAGVADARGG